MSSNDIQLILNTSGPVVFDVYGKSVDTGLLLLQRLYILLLTASTDAYREADDTLDYSLVDLIYGSNVPDTGVLETMISIGCITAVNSLDDDDRALISSFTGYCDDASNIICELKLQDGTTVKGQLTNE